MGRLDRQYYFVEQCRSGIYGTLSEFARRMRAEPTPAEKLLWKYLRGSRQRGLHFRRQHIMDRYIVDFLCLSRLLIIELDGPVHDTPEQQQWDADRTRYLEARGYRVMRYRNEAVLEAPHEVSKEIVTAALARPDRAPEQE